MTTYFWARRFYAGLIRRYIKRGKVLEIGCGYGDLLKNLEETHKTFGVEISEHACREAVRRTRKSKIVNGDAYKYLLNSRASFFDAVIQVCVLPHMENPKEVLKEIARVVRKGGIFLSVVPNINYPLMKLKQEKSSAFRDKTHISLYEIEKWIRLFNSSGFDVISKGSTGWWDVPYFPFVPRLLQLGIFGLPSATQMVFGKLILPADMGVDLITIAKKN